MVPILACAGSESSVWHSVYTQVVHAVLGRVALPSEASEWLQDESGDEASPPPACFVPCASSCALHCLARILSALGLDLQ